MITYKCQDCANVMKSDVPFVFCTFCTSHYIAAGKFEYPKKRKNVMNYERFEKAIREFMEENGFTEVSYCKYIGVARNTFRDALKGNRSTTIGVIEKILAPTPYNIGILRGK